MIEALIEVGGILALIGFGLAIAWAKRHLDEANPNGPKRKQ